MHLLLRTTLLLRLGDVMRVDACERHSEYSRVVHDLIAPRHLALSLGVRPAPGCDTSIRPACDSEDGPFRLQNETNSLKISSSNQTSTRPPTSVSQHQGQR